MSDAVVVEPPWISLKSMSSPFFWYMPVSRPTQEGRFEALVLELATAILVRPAMLAAGLAAVDALDDRGLLGEGAVVPAQAARAKAVSNTTERIPGLGRWEPSPCPLPPWRERVCLLIGRILRDSHCAHRACGRMRAGRSRHFWRRSR